MWVGVGLSMLVVAVLLASDIFPIITNDSLAYIGHSNSITTTGFVQLGYRQVGYPAFLAAIDTLATSVRMEPLLFTVLLQRTLYLSALAFAVWLWRWRALPLVAIAVLPTMMMYSNFILTEGIGVGLALWYAVLVAWVLQRAADESFVVDRRLETRMIIAGSAVGVIYLALATIRFHYILALVGLLAVLYVLYRTGRRARNASMAIAATLLVLGSSFLFFVSRENSQEVGPFFPSVRGERSQFWATWQVTFTLSPENQTNPALSDLYADGDPYKVMGGIDALPVYGDQQTAYTTAIERLIEDSGSSLLPERLKAAVGVLRGGRIDDVYGIVLNASTSSFDSVERSIYRASPARREGIDYVLENYNDGRSIQPVLTSPLAPARTFPYFLDIMQWLLPLAALVLAAGLAFSKIRLLAAVGLMTLLATMVVFGYFLMDNVRFILVPLLFVLTVSTAVADGIWNQAATSRRHGSSPAG